MKLYLVHCGFYDKESGDGVFEFHTNFFVVAPSFTEARKKAKENSTFKAKRMHIDGLQEIRKVDGFEIRCEGAASEAQASDIQSMDYKTLTQLSAAERAQSSS